MTTFESLSSSQKIRAVIHRNVKAICTETLHFLGLEMTKPAMDVIAELVYKKLVVYGGDLEAFSKHGKRNVINTEDVKLLVRRNPSLKAHLNKIAPTNATPKEKRRRTKAPDTPKTNDEQTNPTKENVRISKETDLCEKHGDPENMIVDDTSTIDLTFD